MTDLHVSFRTIFTVPEGKMGEFQAGFSDFYKKTSAGTAKTGRCLYYGFAVNENTVICREGYKNSKDILDHSTEVEQEFGQAMSMVGGMQSGLKLEVFGPEAELKKLKVILEPFNTKFYYLDQGSMAFFKEVDQVILEDSHVTIAPFFKVG